jgi:hypothetical protein
MITKSKLTLALGVVTAIALSAPAAQARTKHHNGKSVQSSVSHARHVDRLHRSYNFVPAPLPGIGIGEPNGPSNWNRNQN